RRAFILDFARTLCGGNGILAASEDRVLLAAQRAGSATVRQEPGTSRSGSPRGRRESGQVGSGWKGGHEIQSDGDLSDETIPLADLRRVRHRFEIGAVDLDHIFFASMNQIFILPSAELNRVHPLIPK